MSEWREVAAALRYLDQEKFAARVVSKTTGVVRVGRFRPSAIGGGDTLFCWTDAATNEPKEVPFPEEGEQYASVEVVAVSPSPSPAPIADATLNGDRGDAESSTAATEGDDAAAAAVSHQLLQLLLDLNPAVRLSANLRLLQREDAENGAFQVDPSSELRRPAIAGSTASSSAANALSAVNGLSAAPPPPGPISFFWKGKQIPVEPKLMPRLSNASATFQPSRQMSLAPNLPPPVSPDLRQRLLNFYEMYNEYKLPSVAAALRQYKGHEEALFKTLELQYGPEPTQADLARQGLLAPLPTGWVQVESTRGDVYYKHADGTVRWSRPKPEGYAAASTGDDALRRVQALL